MFSRHGLNFRHSGNKEQFYSYCYVPKDFVCGYGSGFGNCHGNGHGGFADWIIGEYKCL